VDALRLNPGLWDDRPVTIILTHSMDIIFIIFADKQIWFYDKQCAYVRQASIIITDMIIRWKK
jgi:uncharacterized protein YrrD